MKYHHVGIPSTEPRAGETHVEHLGIYCTDHESNPYGIQWMRYEPGCPVPDLVKTAPHVAFQVDDLEAALAGREVLIEPNSPSEGVRVAFIVQDGAPVELLQFVGDGSPKDRAPRVAETASGALPGLAIREGASSDLPALIAIDERAVADPDRAALLAAHLSRDACLVAEERGSVIGFVFWNRTFFECGFVSLIVVAVAQRRRRVALRLLGAVEERCASPKLFVSANASNGVAQALFGRAGFARSGVIEHLDPGDPEIVFFKAVGT